MFYILDKISRKKSVTAKLLTRDLHAHLIPDIDDGPKTMEESLVLIKGLVQLGMKHLTATPHVFSDYYPNTKEAILKSFQQLEEEVKKAKIEVQLHCAAEYYLDDHFIELLTNNALLPIYENRILVETSTLSQDSNIEHYLFELQAKGFQPILAHPERYLYFENSDFTRLKERGCLFQVNFLSLTGYYGKEVLKKVKFFQEKGYIDYIATDIHHSRHLKAIQKGYANRKVRKLLREVNINNEELYIS